MAFDVIVWGATGFTGRLVAEYLTCHEGAAGEVRWAIAGRSRDKLEAIRRELAAVDPAAAELPIVEADADDEASLRALAAQTKVVCTTVGPYARYGSKLVAACVAEGAHACDLTGEPQWMRRMIDRHHEEAREKGVRIVHACGFDSIPSDLGTFVVEEAAHEAFGQPLPEVRLYTRKVKGGASGGTLASMAILLEEASDPEVRRILGDPYSLLPEGAARGPRVRDVRPVAFDRDEGAWTSSFFMAPTNAKVVRRSAALLDGRYGEGFSYEEMSSFRRGLRGLVTAGGMTAGLGLVTAGMSAGPTRRVLMRFLPSPGEGPSAAEREAGYFVMDVVGRGEVDARAVEVRVTVRGDQDPGYGATSGMLAEAALCLARDELPERYGVLTPASAMGQALVARLPRAGVTFATQITR